MKTQLHLQSNVDIARGGIVHRRDMLRAIAAGTVATGALSFNDRMMLQAAELRRRGMSCIVLWMPGGPSQFDTFSLVSGSSRLLWRMVVAVR